MANGMPSFLPFVLACGVLAVLLLLLLPGLSRCAASGGAGEESSSDGYSSVAATSDSANDSFASRVSFVAVGDNAPNDVLGAYADEQAGDPGDGQYDYRYLFTQVKPYVQAADLAYIDQEVHAGGNDIGPKGYPSFNVTDEIADAVVDAGFDLVASASNHAFDWGYYGAVEHSRELWNAKPVAFTGTARDWNEATEIPVVERNGITFALLSYTTWLNGLDINEVGSHYVNMADEQRLSSDVSRAREMADVVVVAMHWGTENQTEPDSEELNYAQVLADAGADIVLGSHPHVIQPMTWLTGASGNKTLVCYSLGNFVMHHSDPTELNNLEGMLSCDFVRKSDGGSVAIDNVKWIPLVFHGVEGEYSVWPVSSYPEAFAKRNGTYKNIDDPISWLFDQSESIVNGLGGNFDVEGANGKKR